MVNVMNISICDQAFQWYKEELQLQRGDYVRFFARYGGCSNVQKGFSLGVNKEEPIDAAVTLEKNGVIFFVEQNDMWYFDGHDLHIEFDEKQNEPVFTYR
ncbi:hypothetical protein AF2641_10275 [Anoxybacillus flavithermus]|nr:hypothetical protein AF2641_10275 [Anoxybacillus flavithermus]